MTCQSASETPVHDVRHKADSESYLPSLAPGCRDGAEMTAHCWEEGPSICKICRKECEYFCPDHLEGTTTGSSCMLLNGHEGDHEFCPDDEIMVEFK